MDAFCCTHAAYHVYPAFPVALFFAQAGNADYGRQPGIYAPGTGMGMENTIGQPFYAWSDTIKTDGLITGMILGAQANSLSILTRPNAIIKLTI